MLCAVVPWSSPGCLRLLGDVTVQKASGFELFELQSSLVERIRVPSLEFPLRLGAVLSLEQVPWVQKSQQPALISQVW